MTGLKAALTLIALLVFPCPPALAQDGLAGHSLVQEGAFGSLERLQRQVRGLPVGRRIAAMADYFVGTPYDTDPLGVYVRSCSIVCDSEIDCMYLVFRAVELATSDTPEGARDRALELRFKTRGRLVDGKVANYDERFDYAEDMVFSGKWGEDITRRLGRTGTIPGSRGRRTITYLPNDELKKNLARLVDGDIIFFVKDPKKRVVGEVVGHEGIVKREDGRVLLIHASGAKSSKDRPGGGMVRRTELKAYLEKSRFIGVMVTRFSAP